MTWFTASVLIAIKPKSYAGGAFEVYENMYLLEAPTSSDAYQKAVLLGKEEESIDDNLKIDDLPAERSFIGIRKIITVSNPYPLDLDEDRPISGTEVTYALYQVADDQIATKLANGEDVDLTYLK
jgi:hypothetical protein